MVPFIDNEMYTLIIISVLTLTIVSSPQITYSKVTSILARYLLPNYLAINSIQRWLEPFRFSVHGVTASSPNQYSFPNLSRQTVFIVVCDPSCKPPIFSLMKLFHVFLYKTRLCITCTVVGPHVFLASGKQVSRCLSYVYWPISLRAPLTLNLIINIVLPAFTTFPPLNTASQTFTVPTPYVLCRVWFLQLAL